MSVRNVFRGVVGWGRRGVGLGDPYLLRYSGGVGT